MYVYIFPHPNKEFVLNNLVNFGIAYNFLLLTSIEQIILPTVGSNFVQDTYAQISEHEGISAGYIQIERVEKHLWRAIGAR